MRVLVAALIGLSTLLLPAGPASAHAALVAATPDPGSVVASAPDEITLTFTEGIRGVPDRTQSDHGHDEYAHDPRPPSRCSPCHGR